MKFQWTSLRWALLLLGSISPRMHACTSHGQSVTDEGWSKTLRRVCLNETTTSNSYESPDKRKALIADQDGFQIKIDGKNIDWPEGKNLFPNGSEISWSPTSSAFFINYSNGSGLDGWTLKSFSIQNNQVIAQEGVNLEIVKRFRGALKCSKTSVDPNVRGLGWTNDGLSLFAFAQATVNSSCGEQGTFRGVVTSPADGHISAFYSEHEAQRHFHHLLPFNMR